MWNPFRRKEQRSEPITIDEFLSYMGVNNTGAGVMSPNEVRRREGLPPYAGGDEFSQAWKQTVEVKRNDSVNENEVNDA